jgi:translocation and assembly module TamB
LKKYVRIVFIVIVLFVVAITFAANSSAVIQKVWENFVRPYGLRAARIEGNLIKGITLHDVRFENKALLKSFRFRWSPLSLLYGNIAITTLEAHHIQIDTVRSLVETFASTQKESHHKARNKKGNLPFSLSLGHIDITVDPFTYEGMHIDTLHVKADELFYGDGIKLNNFKIDVNSSLAHVEVIAGLNNKTVSLRRIKISRVDTIRLTKILKKPSQTQRAQKKNNEKNDSNITDFIRRIKLRHAELSLLPDVFEDIRWDKAKITLDDASFDIAAWRSAAYKEALHFDASLHIVSNLGNIRSDVAWRGDAIRIGNLSLQKTDVNRLHARIAHFAETNEKTEDRNDTSLPAWLPEVLNVEHASVDTLAFAFPPLKVKKTSLSIEKLLVELDSMTLNSGKIDVDIQSNFARIIQHGKVIRNRLDGKVRIVPHQALFEYYGLPVRPKAIERVFVDYNLTKEVIRARLYGSAKELFIADTDDSNVTSFQADINRFVLLVDLPFKTLEPKISVHADLNATYIPKIVVDAKMRPNHGILHYEATAEIPEVHYSDANISSIFEATTLHVNGDVKSAEATFSSRMLEGKVLLPDFNATGRAWLQTKQPLKLSHFISLPSDLNRSEFSFKLVAPVRMRNPLPLECNATIDSNLVTAILEATYDKKAKAHLRMRSAKDSLLYRIKQVQWDALLPLEADIVTDNRTMVMKLHTPKLKGDMKIYPLQGDIEGRAFVSGMNLALKGNIKQDVVLTAHVDSFKRLIRSIDTVYALKHPPKLEGALDASLIISKNNDAMLVLSSPHMRFQADRRTFYEADDVDILLSKKGNSYRIPAYRFVINDKVFYASKPSVVDVNTTFIDIKEVWLNDALKINGVFDAKKMQGKIRADAERFPYSDEFVDLNASIHLAASFNAGATNIDGNVTLLQTHVFYNLDTKNFPSDNDIVIVEDYSDDNDTFMENLSLNIAVRSAKPVIYRQGPVDMQADVDLTLFKVPGSELMLLGNLTLIDGGSYTFEGKRFYVENSKIYFTGNFLEPMLDIKVKYKALRYLVTLYITGTPGIPNIIFSSTPHLTREQILSLILFDTVDSGDDADAMMKMMGGAMAKAALNDFGVQVDRLVIGENNSVEVGKKLDDKTMVIYVNGEIPEVRLRYEYTPNLDVVIGASERSQSVDIIYRNDFDFTNSASDIIISR